MSTKPYAYCVERRQVEGRWYWAVGYYDDKGAWSLCGFGRSKRAQERQAWEWNHGVWQLPMPENRHPRPHAARTGRSVPQLCAADAPFSEDAAE